MNNKHKKALAGTLALSLLACGTFAWQSFSQRATNETITFGTTTGGRLHNYFSGTNPEGAEKSKVQEVFVENYGNRDGNPIVDAGNVYARVRLFEYLEYGDGAGILQKELDDDADLFRDDAGIKVVRGDILNDVTPTIEDKTTWDIYQYGSAAGAGESIRKYRDLKFGGETVYMPTFDQRTDSKAVENNGSLEGSTEDRLDGTSYDDYVKYEIGTDEEGVHYKEGTVQYLDQSGSERLSEEQTYYAQGTLDSTIITMEAWKELDPALQIDNVWVYDTDGWAYWSAPIAPDTATGLLLNSMIEVETVEETTTYYAVHAEAQLASAGDWGVKNSADKTEQGMYADGLSDNGLLLLETVSQDQGASATMAMSLFGEEYATEVVTIDGVTFQVLDTRTITSVDENGYSTGTVDAKLLWALESVAELPLGVVTQNSWADSQIRNSILTQWLASKPNLSEAAVRVPVVTDGYYNSADTYASTEDLDEVTYDQVFLLSQIEFLSTYGLKGITSVSKLAYDYSYLRTFRAESLPGVVDHNLGVITDTALGMDASLGIRPAMWVSYK